MKLEEVIDAISKASLHEHSCPGIELKSSWHIDYGEKISGLANKEIEGTRWLIIGVENSGNLTGHDEKWAIKNEEIVSQHLNQNLDPIQAVIGVHCRGLIGGWIIAIEIERPGDLVHWKKRAYKMSGTTVSIMEPYEVLNARLTLPGLIDYSRQIIDTECNETLFNCFIEDTHRKMDRFEDFQSDILGRQVSRILFGNCEYRVAVVDNADNVIVNDSRQGLYGILLPKFREEIRIKTEEVSGNSCASYPDVALKEALANAVAHSAFFERDGEILIEIHPDKLCISNLCTKEAALFANKWFSRKHQTLNGLLMETLRLCGAVDELGLGKIKIIGETLKQGQRPPYVVLEEAARYDRWKLWLWGSAPDAKAIKVLEESKRVFGDEKKALIAMSLIHWKDKNVEEVKQYVDGDFLRKFAEVLSEWDGPVWQTDTGLIRLSRWARIMLSEGRASKGFEPFEEERLQKGLFESARKNGGNKFSHANLKKHADLGNSRAAANQTSKLLRKWCSENKIRKLSKGMYEVLPEPRSHTFEFQKLLEIWRTSSSS